MILYYIKKVIIHYQINKKQYKRDNPHLYPMEFKPKGSVAPHTFR